MLLKKSKYRTSPKKSWLDKIKSQLGLTGSQKEKSVEIYETFRDYMTLEQCSEKEAISFTAKFYRLPHYQLNQILSEFNEE